jgi:hypothetical protein
MLSEVLEAAAPIKRAKRPGRSGISISQLYPCSYRLRLVHDGNYWEEEITPQQYYNMDDGWTQEDQSVKRLAKAGIIINNRDFQGRSVTIGKSKVPGSSDGTFTLSGIRRVWEHKAYDNDTSAVWTLKNLGMDYLPNQKSQVNGYMMGYGLQEAVFFVKIKNNNTYIDTIVKLDRPFIEEIIEWCDKIRLEDWKPEPVKTPWCASCGLGCFGDLLDFSWVGQRPSDELSRTMADKWLQGDKLEKLGDMLKNESRAYFVGDSKAEIEGIIGDESLLVVEDLLEVKKIIQHRFTISKQRVLEEFGPEGLIKVGEESKVTQYRFKGLT